MANRRSSSHRSAVKVLQSKITEKEQHLTNLRVTSDAKIVRLEKLLDDRESEIMRQDKDLEQAKQACMWLVKADWKERFHWLVYPGQLIIRKFPFVFHVERALKGESEDDRHGEG